MSIIMIAGTLVYRRKYIDSEGQLEYGTFAMACFLFFLATLPLNYQVFFEGEFYRMVALSVMEWSRMSAIAVAMCGLIFLNRNARPGITRFPVLFCWVPLLLIPVYALVVNTIFLKEVLLGIYEAGSIIVALLMYGLFLSRDRKYLLIVAGLLILLSGYFLMWVFRLSEPSMPDGDYSWVVQLVLAWGSGLLFYGTHKT
ncbi:MAG: hypothetical protein ACNA8K_09885 [Cyclonatronaceae bacterium]